MRQKRILAAALVAAFALTVAAPSAKAEPDDPIVVYRPSPQFTLEPPPTAYLEAPCGLAVDSAGDFYVSDYHHDTVDVYAPPAGYLTQLTAVDPLDGPCGLAVDAAGGLLVNDYHRSVARYQPSAFPPLGATPFPPTAATSYGAPTTIVAPAADSAEGPTGVAVGPGDQRVYVDERSYVAVYEPTGAPVELAGEPLRIGVGSLRDGYGVAVDAAGRVYVPDAGEETVKVYDPAAGDADPVATIDGHGVPGGGFTSLRDSAIAVDDVSGNVYVADDLEPCCTEEPEAAIYVFDSGGAYLGRLKRNIVDALPPGLAVDNSSEATQGRVYVTSGNTEIAAVVAYPPGAETSAVLQAEKQLGRPPRGAAPSARATTFSAVGGVTQAPAGAAAAHASEVTQKGDLRLSLEGALSPRRLPAAGAAPVAVSVGWKLSTTDGGPVPNLRSVKIDINRHGLLDQAGLPTCALDRIQPASSAQALAACRGALVGRGSFEAEISLAGQERYPTHGRLLVFNGSRHGRPVLLGQIYAPHPFATSFVIVFSVKRLGHGTYGTELLAKLPASLSGWGNLTAVTMRLGRRYRAGGRPHSYLSAACPAPKGFPGATFPLTRARFELAGGATMGQTLTRACRVR